MNARTTLTARRACTTPVASRLAGIGLGLVLLAAFVLVGRGLGASGAFNATIAWLGSLALWMALHDLHRDRRGRPLADQHELGLVSEM